MPTQVRLQVARHQPPARSKEEIARVHALASPRSSQGIGTAPREEEIMIVLGIILLVVGFVTGISILWTIGIILAAVGAILWVLGAMGHAVAGRRHYW